MARDPRCTSDGPLDPHTLVRRRIQHRLLLLGRRGRRRLFFFLLLRRLLLHWCGDEVRDLGQRRLGLVLLFVEPGCERGHRRRERAQRAADGAPDHVHGRAVEVGVAAASRRTGACWGSSRGGAVEAGEGGVSAGIIRIGGRFEGLGGKAHVEVSGTTMATVPVATRDSVVAGRVEVGVASVVGTMEVVPDYVNIWFVFHSEFKRVRCRLFVTHGSA